MIKYYEENIAKGDGISLEEIKDKLGIDDISLATNNPSDLANGISVDGNGVINAKVELAYGVTYKKYINGWSEGKSSILIAPKVKSFGVLGVNLTFKHEFMHAWHWRILPNAVNQSTYSERATSTFTIAYIKAYGLQNRLSDIFKGAYQNLAPTDTMYYHEFFNTVYPKFMSWRKFNQIIPTWIK